MDQILVAFKKAVLNNYANFQGRTTRKDFWYFILAQVIIDIIYVLLLWLLPDQRYAWGALYRVYIIVLLSPSIAIQVRRLHDVGLSGWIFLIDFIPFLGGLILAIIDCFPASPKGEKYGSYF